MTNTPTEDDLDAAATALIKRLAKILYIEEMGDVQRVRKMKSRSQAKHRIRTAYGQWINTEQIDREQGWRY